MKELVVPSKFNNKKLQSFLMHNFPSLTNSLFYKTLRKKDIKINNIRISENILLHTNDNVKVYISDELLLPNTQIKINIIYEDNNILIANKPEQIEVTGDSGLTCLLKKQHNFKFLEPCHRLDRNTTGLTLFAKNQEALNILLNKFKIKICYEVFDGSIPPLDWIDIINDNFDICSSPSAWVRDRLVKYGVKIPCFHLPCVVFNDDLLQMKPKKKKVSDIYY